jgi:undecaprenyl pyrophosphate phosphatase UppP
MNKETLSNYVTLIATVTLSIILLSMVFVLLTGLFFDKVDNTKIFEAITPAFQTIVGGFIGLITGIKIGEKDEG